MPQTQPKKIIRRPTVEQRTGLGTSRLYQLAAEGKFPKQVCLSGRAVGWIEHEVDQWIEARAAEREAKTTAIKRNREAA